MWSPQPHFSEKLNTTTLLEKDSYVFSKSMPILKNILLQNSQEKCFAKF